MKINDKIALVTGGSRGLGKNYALKLAETGADVILTYHSRKDEADATVASIEAMGRKAAALKLDSGQVDTFNQFFGEVKELLQSRWNRASFDFLVNNAGIESSAPIADMTEENFDLLLNIHFKGVYFLTQKALPVISDGGRIINISTGLARFAIPGYSAYASMKGAIEVFTRYLAKELGPRGITANVVAPGAIETDFTRPGFDARPGAREHIASQTALGRVGLPEDLGGVVAFLCTDEARWINAQRIEASGGMFL